MNDILERIDAAIARLRVGNPTSIMRPIAIANLLEKRARVVNGIYQPDEDAARMVALFAVVGAGICESVKAREEWYYVTS